MDTGLLWYDDDPQRTLEAKIGRAAERYREKYGRLPDTCYVHPLAVDGQPAGSAEAAGKAGVVQLNYALPGAQSAAQPAQRPGRAKAQPTLPAGPARGTMRVISAPNVLRHHFWLGESSGS